jgi:iron(III) transport system ATP-binding protein
MNLLTIRQLQFNFKSTSTFKGLQKISFNVNEGEVKVIIGESGCGKSTLLRCINGFHDLDSGSIQLHDEKILGPAYNLIPGHNAIQYVSQEAMLLENHTVEENILDRLSGYKETYKTKTTKHLLKTLNLIGLEKQKPKFLSSGQRQRISIARALAADPQLYLLDEPFTNLDYPTKRAIWQTLLDKVKTKKTAVLLVTHLPEDVWEIANEVLVMEDGKIIQKGSVEEVYYHAKNEYTANILGEYSLIPMSSLEKELKENKIFKKSYLIRPQQIVISEKATKYKVEIVHIFKTSTLLNKYVALFKQEIEIIFFSEKKLKAGISVFIDLLPPLLGQ